MKLIEKNIKEIDVALWRERNGAVVGSMQNLVPKSEVFSYGVSLPTIKAICQGFEPSVELALQLFASKTREHKLAAVYIMPPTELSSDIMCQVVLLLENVEIANVAAQALLFKSPVAADVVMVWLESGGWLQKHTAMMMVGRMAKLNMVSSDIGDKVVDILITNYLSQCEEQGFRASFCYAISNLAQCFDNKRAKVISAIENYGSDAIKLELLWQLV